MIPIKIQCGCGQRYAFEVETDNGVMPYAVTCPICGADGTAAANEILAQNATVAATPVTIPAATSRIHVTVPPPQIQTTSSNPPSPVDSPRKRGLSPLLQKDRTQVEHEARAKIFWGDPPEEAVKFMMMNGIPGEEAYGLVQAMFQERAATIRKNGIGKIILGIPLVCVPIAAFFIFQRVGYFSVRLFALPVMVGLWGAWLLLKGSIMFFAPKSEPGDVSSQ